MTDKKGGGLMVLGEDDCELTVLDTNSSDILLYERLIETTYWDF